MNQHASFIHEVQTGYSFEGPTFLLGKAKIGTQVFDECPVNIPLKTLNRHGLITGATGTGKTKTLQLMAEGLSDAGVPSLLLDIKGDLSGLAAAGAFTDKIKERYSLLNASYAPAFYPVELLSLSKEKGVRLKATVSEFGPVLLSKALDLNDTQEGIVAVLFKYCDDNGLPVLDLKDFTRLLQFAMNEGKSEISKEYGNISPASLRTILRKIIALDQQGAEVFFGEISFDILDLLRPSADGRGNIHILRVTDMQSRPQLFATFMLQMLAEVYATLPESGDLSQPKLVLFIDEAHLLFKNATKVLLQEVETTVKLIRSKGVGVFFCTQSPMDIPPSVLGQLGLKVQHALRAFTARDRSAIKKAAENFPTTTYYAADKLITQLGIGEAMISLLNEKGIPTPVVHTLLLSPRSRMGILSEQELDEVVARSRLVPKYNVQQDRESAFEILNQKMKQYAAAAAEKKTATNGHSSSHPSKSWWESSLNSYTGKLVQRSLIRTVMGMILKAIK